MAKQASGKPTSKSEIYNFIAEKTGIRRKDVAAVFDALKDVIVQDLKKVGVSNMAGLAKIKVIRKPAVPAHKGINPFTKEEVIFKAKPARNVVKIKALRPIKEMA